MTRTAMSLHFLLCLMIPPIWVVPSLDGYLPITAPKGPLIFKLVCVSININIITKKQAWFSVQHYRDSLTVAEEMQIEEQQGTEVK